MTSAAVIDVGSNAVRLAIGSVDHSGRLVVVENYREAIRLGQDVFGSGAISSQAIERLSNAFCQFRDAMRRHGVKKIRAVATSAMREARNQSEVLRVVERRSGIKLEVISGTEEARIVSDAVISTVDLAGQLALLIDIGGGSLEISLVDDGDVIFSDSVKLGAVRLLKILDEHKKPPKLFQRLVRAYSAKLRRSLKKELRGRSIDICVGTGGNLDELLKLREIILKKEPKASVTNKELDRISERLSSLSLEDRIKKLGLREDRADVIVPATIVLQSILKYSGVKAIQVPKVGLKEGLLINLLSTGDAHSPARYHRQLMAYVSELGVRFDIDSKHAIKVRQLACDLFDQLQSLHRFGDDSRLLLEVAAYLHDIGYAINLNDHHLHGAYIIRATPLVGLSDLQRNLVALIVRYHRKGSPKNEHLEFASLGKEDKRRVVGLSAILRIAEALDKGHSGSVRALTVEKRGKKLRLKLRGRGGFQLERWAVPVKAELFEKFFDKKIEVAE